MRKKKSLPWRFIFAIVASFIVTDLALHAYGVGLVSFFLSSFAYLVIFRIAFGDPDDYGY